MNLTKQKMIITALVVSAGAGLIYYSVFNDSVRNIFAQEEDPNQHLETMPSLEERTGTDQEALESEADYIEQLQNEDRQECLAQAGLGGGGEVGGALGQAAHNGLATITQETVNEHLPAELEREVTERLPAELERGIQNNLPDQLSRLLRLGTATRPSFEEALAANLNLNPGQTIDAETFEQIFRDTFTTSVETHLPNALQRTLNQALPDAFGRVLEEGLPTALERVMTENLPGAIETDLPEILNRDLSATTLDFLTTETAGLDGLTAQVLEQLNDDLLAEISTQAVASINNQNNLLTEDFTGIFGEQLATVLEDNGGALDEIVAQLSQGLGNGSIGGSAGGFVNQAVTEILGGTNMNQLMAGVNNQFSNIINTTVNDLTGSLLGSANGLINQVTGSVLAPLNDVVDSVMGTVLDPLNEVVDSVMGTVLDPVTGVFNNVLGGVGEAFNGALGSMTENVLGGLNLGSLTGPLGEAVGGAVEALTGGLGGLSLPGLNLIPGLGGGLYVPVKEVDGPLLSSNQNIDESTKSIQELTVQMCMYLKSIQRIQTAAEQREVMENPDLRRQAASNIEQYRHELADLVDRGHKTDGEGTESPLYVTDTERYLREVIQPETNQVYLDQLEGEESGDAFKAETAAALRRQISQPDIPRSSISREVYNNFVSGNTGSADVFQNLIAINNPFEANNPATSFMLNQTALSLRQRQAEENFRNELVAGQGYLPIRNCIEPTASGACAKWEITTPAIQVKESVADAFSYRQELYTDPEPGDLAPGNEPTAQEVLSFKPQSTGGGGGSPAAAAGGGGAGDMIQRILDVLSSLRNRETYTAPELTFNIAKPTANQIAAGNNIAVLNWEGQGIDTCVADNNWPAGNPTGSGIVPIVTDGETLDSNGEREITLPLNFGVNFLRERPGDITRIVTGTVISQSANDGSHQITTITMPDDIQGNDTFRIALGPNANSTSAGARDPYSVAIQIHADGGDKAGMVETFKQTINNTISSTNENTIQRNEFNKYLFNFRPTTGTITIKPKTNYQLRCTTNNGDPITKEITLGN
ncbi:MAG: hypothetical protein WDZ85_03205 [Candidatus Paceibacterota bacterium]